MAEVTQEQEFGAKIVKHAVSAAREYFAKHCCLPVSEVAFRECLLSNLKARMDEACRDAREAYSAGMDEIARVTFLATVRLAGIDAAKECAAPVVGLN